MRKEFLEFPLVPMSSFTPSRKPPNYFRHNLGVCVAEVGACAREDGHVALAEQTIGGFQAGTKGVLFTGEHQDGDV